MLFMGCRASLGECNDLGLSIVYKNDATLGAIPMYGGQALMVQSCGSQNGNCHSAAAEGVGRVAVPVGFDFDVNPLDSAVCGENINSTDCLAEQNRLRTAAQIAFEYRVLSWNEVAEGRMPPGGAVAPATELYFRSVTPTGYASPLPGLHTDEGKDIFRNWVACGMPVVGQVGVPGGSVSVGDNCDDEDEDARAYGQCRVGSEPPSPPASTWGGDDGIHAFILNSGCAIDQCHGGDVSPTLSGDPMMAYDAVFGASASDDQDCGGRTLVMANDVEGSLLYEKLAKSEDDPPACGDEMPAGSDALPEEFLMPIREWINAGANP